MCLGVNYKLIYFLVVFGSLINLALNGICQDQKAVQDAVFESIQLEQNDRVLILAPHPDDEVLGCGGIIQKAMAKQLPLKVVFFTYGDNNEWAFLIYRKHPVLLSSAVEGMGLIRHNEAVEAANVFGLSPDQLVFLGYPDFGTLNIWYRHWNHSPAFKSLLTKVRAVPYKNAFRPGASYKGEEIINDLEHILNDFKPTKIFISHPADHNGDHRSLYLFTTVALWDMKMEEGVNIYPYLVHYKSWPLPKGYHPDLEITPPDLFKEEIPWKTSILDFQEIEKKEDSLKKHHSEYISSQEYLESFIRKNELFGDFYKIVLTDMKNHVDLSRNRQDDNNIVPEGLIDEERAAFVGIETHSISIEGTNIVFSMKLSRKLANKVGLSIYLFGYRHDTLFARMPKIHIKLGAIFHKIYDQKQPIAIRGSEIKVLRSGQEITIKMPRYLLGNPERILTSANTYLGNIPLDWVSWRIVELPQTKTKR
jgi:LmbE family N-acetylglucosaminyl deacetylase